MTNLCALLVARFPCLGLVASFSFFCFCACPLLLPYWLGSAGVGRLVTLDDGCVCCTINQSLVDSVLQLLSHQSVRPGKGGSDDDQGEGNGASERGFDHLILETSGVAEMEPVLNSLERHEQLAELTHIDSVLW